VWGAFRDDWLWHDTSGNVAMWFMDGAQVTQSARVGTSHRLVDLSRQRRLIKQCGGAEIGRQV